MSEKEHSTTSRRGFFTTLAPLGAGLILIGCAKEEAGKSGGSDERKEESNGGQEVTPTEDLMREHGLLNRILLIYDDVLQRIGGGSTFPPEAISGAANVMRNFVEDYHEKMEEDFLFPRFEKAGKLTDLVKTLRCQHDAGRRLTDQIMSGARPGALATRDQQLALAEALRSFNRMYRPHEAREDTVLFPALRSIVSGHEFDALGEDFEKREHQLFGSDGFETMVEKVDTLERMLGIEELTQFTPGACP